MRLFMLFLLLALVAACATPAAVEPAPEQAPARVEPPTEDIAILEEELVEEEVQYTLETSDHVFQEITKTIEILP